MQNHHLQPPPSENELLNALEPLIEQLSQQQQQIQELQQANQTPSDLQQQLNALISALQPLPQRLTSLETKVDGISKQVRSSHRQGQTIHNQIASILPLDQEENRVLLTNLNEQFNQLQQAQSQPPGETIEVQASLSALLTSLSSFNERLRLIEIEQGRQSVQIAVQTDSTDIQSERISRVNKSQSSLERELKALRQKLPSPMSFPLNLVLEGKIFTYRGLILLIALVVTYAIAFAWMLNQFLPGTLTRINGRVNNIEKRLERIEKWVKP